MSGLSGSSIGVTSHISPLAISKIHEFVFGPLVQYITLLSSNFIRIRVYEAQWYLQFLHHWVVLLHAIHDLSSYLMMTDEGVHWNMTTP
jgi:hypothetical protein